jgi:hypothetical protein
VPGNHRLFFPVTFLNLTKDTVTVGDILFGIVEGAQSWHIQGEFLCVQNYRAIERLHGPFAVLTDAILLLLLGDLLQKRYVGLDGMNGSSLLLIHAFFLSLPFVDWRENARDTEVSWGSTTISMRDTG